VVFWTRRLQAHCKTWEPGFAKAVSKNHELKKPLLRKEALDECPITWSPPPEVEGRL